MAYATPFKRDDFECCSIEEITDDELVQDLIEGILSGNPYQAVTQYLIAKLTQEGRRVAQRILFEILRNVFRGIIVGTSTG